MPAGVSIYHISKVLLRTLISRYHYCYLDHSLFPETYVVKSVFGFFGHFAKLEAIIYTARLDHGASNLGTYPSDFCLSRA